MKYDSTIDQADSWWLLIAEAGVRLQDSVVFVEDRMVLVQAFSKYLEFSLAFIIPPMLRITDLTPVGWTLFPLKAAVPPPSPTKWFKTLKYIFVS